MCLFAILDLGVFGERTSCEREKDIGRDVETKDGGERAEDGEDADAELVEWRQLRDGSFLELFFGEGEELDVGRCFGRVDDARYQSRSQVWYG